jgi:hypothetical protein
MLVIMALTLIALMGLAGLVLDGGRAYANHREVQNVADAAALAGTGVLSKILSASAGHEKEPYDAVVASLAANHITPSGNPCVLVDVTGTAHDPCPTANTTTGLPAYAAGVAVAASSTLPASFIKVVGITSFQATGSATAQVQALRGGSAPFMVCGRDGTFDNNTANPQALLLADSTLNPPWRINSLAVGHTYTVHASHVNTCGAHGQSFKGRVDEATSFTLPTWLDAATGKAVGPVRQQLALPSACSDNTGIDQPGGCSMILPLCTDGTGSGSHTQLYCVRWGAFLITPVGNDHDGLFLGEANVSGGGQGGGIPIAGEARYIKLTR